jgi:1-phosphatidylinositol-4-phosphate 5-kinase
VRCPCRYRVPSAQKNKRRSDDDAASLAGSDISGSSPLGIPVNVVRRTLQSALTNAQSVFNPAFKEFRFKDFSPGYFAKVREMCDMTAEEYSRSFEATCKETFSEGRSGAFMFFSSDQRCIAKSTSKAELLSLQKLMPEYVDYLTANPNCLITRFIGAHCITMYGVELYFVVMLNCFPPHRLSERYDLKGSWVNRHALTKTEFSGRSRRKGAVKSPLLYLDNDLQHKLSLQPGVAQQIAEQIFKDVEFLTSKPLDISLLRYSL